MHTEGSIFNEIVADLSRHVELVRSGIALAVQNFEVLTESSESRLEENLSMLKMHLMHLEEFLYKMNVIKELLSYLPSKKGFLHWSCISERSTQIISKCTDGENWFNSLRIDSREFAERMQKRDQLIVEIHSYLSWIESVILKLYSDHSAGGLKTGQSDETKSLLARVARLGERMESDISTWRHRRGTIKESGAPLLEQYVSCRIQTFEEYAHLLALCECQLEKH